MTLKELYDMIGGSYDRAISVLRVEKLIDKHIRKFTKSGVVESVIEAGKNFDKTAMFETAHAMKGVCGNLGLVKLADMASDITEEFRPGASRKFTDEEIMNKINGIKALYEKTAEGIGKYEEIAQ